MTLITDEALAESLHLPRWALPAAKRLLALPRLEELGRSAGDLTGPAFAAAILEALDIEVQVTTGDPGSWPPTSPVVVVSNHPFGLLDGLALIASLGARGQRAAVLANYLLATLRPLEKQLIPVNAFDRGGDGRTNIASLRRAFRGSSSTSLILFPAGDVASFRMRAFKVVDRPWNSTPVKLISRMRLPVLPVHIEGRNSFLYQVLNFIHPKLAVLRLPRELLNKRGWTVRVRVGRPIHLDREDSGLSPELLGRRLRAQVEALGAEEAACRRRGCRGVSP